MKNATNNQACHSINLYRAKAYVYDEMLASIYGKYSDKAFYGVLLIDTSVEGILEQMAAKYAHIKFAYDSQYKGYEEKAVYGYEMAHLGDIELVSTTTYDEYWNKLEEIQYIERIA